MTRHLFAHWKPVERRIKRARRIAFFTDFDGTIAPIRRDAGRVRLAAGVRQLLTGLAARGILVGVVSGRALDDVRTRVGVKGIWYGGDHGFDVRGPNRRPFRLATRAQQARISLVTRRLRHELRGIAGVTVDAKGATVAVHYRQASVPNEHLAAEIVQRTIGERRGLRLTHGKKVWEVMPAGTVDKSTAIERILRLERRQLGGAPLAIYMGDDVSDERVFAEWEGLSIAVGYQPHTAAQYYLRSLAEVREFLRRLQNI